MTEHDDREDRQGGDATDDAEGREEAGHPRGPADEEAEGPAQPEPQADELREDKPGSDLGSEETGQESNPGRVMTYEEAREVREEPDAVEGVPVGAGGPAEERGDRIPPDQASGDPERIQRLSTAADERSQVGFDTDREAVTEPDEPVAETETIKDIEGIPETAERTHEAEGLTTLEEAVQPTEGRYGELMEKRKRIGLTDAEASELGRLVAEQEGQEYWSARTARGDGEEAETSS